MKSYIISGFILGGVYGAPHPVCHSDEKFPPSCLLILIELPDTQKCALAKEKFKNRTKRPVKTLVTTNKLLYM